MHGKPLYDVTDLQNLGFCDQRKNSSDFFDGAGYCVKIKTLIYYFERTFTSELT